MKGILLGVLAAMVLLVSPLRAEEIGVKIVNTGPVACQPGLIHRDTWINHFGDIRITRSEIWVGFNYKTLADVDVEVYRSDGNALIAAPSDHYYDGSILVHRYNNMDLRLGDFLHIDYFCNNFYVKGAARNPNFHVVVWIYYEFKGGTPNG